MPKWIGNRFGSIVPIAPNADAPSAIYNLFDQYYSKVDGGWVNPTGMTATGGVVSDYVDGSDVYRAHIFTASGTFEVTASGTFGDTLEYLVVAGGGSGGGYSGANGGGGGGGGGLRTNLSGHPLAAPSYTVPAFPTSYTVTVGGGGSRNTSPSKGNQGSNSEFYPTPVSYPSTARIRAVGGGYGGYDPHPDSEGGAGGSGGGGWDRYSSTGKKLGKCGDGKEGEAYAACLSKSKARKLGKKGIASFVKRKRAAQKKGGDPKKGGERSKGQKTIKVKTGA